MIAFNTVLPLISFLILYIFTFKYAIATVIKEYKRSIVAQTPLYPS